jgi:hypothetical protein
MAQEVIFLFYSNKTPQECCHLRKVLYICGVVGRYVLGITY